MVASPTVPKDGLSTPQKVGVAAGFLVGWGVVGSVIDAFLSLAGSEDVSFAASSFASGFAAVYLSVFIAVGHRGRIARLSARIVTLLSVYFLVSGMLANDLAFDVDWRWLAGFFALSLAGAWQAVWLIRAGKAGRWMADKVPEPAPSTPASIPVADRRSE